VYLTENGKSDMVVMSVEAYENDCFEYEVYQKLREAEIEAESTDVRLTSEEVFSSLRAELAKKKHDA
jgi:PHD/YefM family antitoxin component YafN of YafNO toxin-antitoxin module